MKKLSISIIIPTYNGLELLRKYLPSVIKAGEKCENVLEIIIVDDGSTDNTINFLKEKYKNIRIITLKYNRGFVFAVNHGVQKSRGDLFLLLNNDIKVDINFIEPLVSHFYKQKDIFAVTSMSIINYENLKNVTETVSKYVWKNGMLFINQPGLGNPDFAVKSVSTNSHAHGGFSLFDKKKFTALHGFDTLYEPFYWEDIDISFRAWKRGWKIIYEPDSIVYHRSHSSICKIMKAEDIERIYHKNNLLFIWKNITDSKLLKEHIEFLILKLKDYKETFYKINFYNTLKQISDIIARNKYNGKISDREIIRISSNIPV